MIINGSPTLLFGPGRLQDMLFAKPVTEMGLSLEIETACVLEKSLDINSPVPIFPALVPLIKISLSGSEARIFTNSPEVLPAKGT